MLSGRRWKSLKDVHSKGRALESRRPENPARPGEVPSTSTLHVRRHRAPSKTVYLSNVGTAKCIDPPMVGGEHMRGRSGE